MAFEEKMSFSGDQTVKKTDVFIGGRSGKGVLQIRRVAFPDFSLKVGHGQGIRVTCFAI